MTESIHEQLELYAAAVLSETEMLTFDDHLATCSLCQIRVPNALDTIASLIPDSTPPRGTWRRIAAAIDD